MRHPLAERLGAFVGVQRLDPPVLRAVRRAADVQAPSSRTEMYQCGTFQRLGGEVCAGQAQHRFEAHAVGRAGNHQTHTAPLVQAQSHPIRKPERAAPSSALGASAQWPGPLPGAGTTTSARSYRGARPLVLVVIRKV
jgi:hypothetical protein